jgi:gallate dioxygenase
LAGPSRARFTHYGITFFMLEKPGAVVGLSNLHVRAAITGGTLEAFRKTRDASGALCPVAGADAKLFDRDRKHTGA